MAKTNRVSLSQVQHLDLFGFCYKLSDFTHVYVAFLEGCPSIMDGQILNKPLAFRRRCSCGDFVGVP